MNERENLNTKKRLEFHFYTYDVFIVFHFDLLTIKIKFQLFVGKNMLNKVFGVFIYTPITTKKVKKSGAIIVIVL